MFDIKKLRKLSWRGIEARFLSKAPYTVTQRQAPRQYPYLPVPGHDNTGHDGAAIQVELFFNEALAAGSYTKDWPKFRDALYDGSSGDLVHPDLGKIRAVVLSFSPDLTAQNRAGIVVQVAWQQTRDNPDQPVNAQAPAPDAKAVAVAADAAIAALKIRYPDGLGATTAALAQVKILYPNGDSEGTVFDLINGIIGSMNSLGLALAGKVTQAAALIDQMVSGVEALNDPYAWPAIDNLIQASASLQNSANKVIAAERPTAKKTIAAEMTLDNFAELVGNTLEEVAGLNPSTLFSPIVEKGTTLSYFTA